MNLYAKQMKYFAYLIIPLLFSGQILANHDIENNIIVYCNQWEIELSDYLTIPEDEVAYEYLWKIDSDNDGSFEYDLDDFNTDPSFSFTPTNLSVDESLDLNLLVRDPDGFVCAYASNITAKAKKIPLGQEIVVNDQSCYFKIYVPTRHRGKLTLFSAGTTVESWTYSDGSEQSGPPWVIQVSHYLNVGKEREGWHNFVATNESEQWTISNTFKQVAEATKRPWNFYWWGYPNVDKVASPALYNKEDFNGVETEKPLYTYDKHFNSATFDIDVVQQTIPDEQALNAALAVAENSRVWEQIEAEYRIASGEQVSWWGHCNGSAKASIYLDEPEPNDNEQHGLSVWELKGLYGETFEGSMQYPLGATKGYGADKNMDPGVTSINLNEEADNWADDFHRTLETYLNANANEDNKLALYANLRIKAGQQGDFTEVWNHAIYYYEATYTQEALQENGDESGDETVVRIDIEVRANCDGYISGPDSCQPISNPDFDPGLPISDTNLQFIADFRQVD